MSRAAATAGRCPLGGLVVLFMIAASVGLFLALSSIEQSPPDDDADSAVEPAQPDA